MKSRWISKRKAWIGVSAAALLGGVIWAVFRPGGPVGHASKIGVVAMLDFFGASQKPESQANPGGSAQSKQPEDSAEATGDESTQVHASDQALAQAQSKEQFRAWLSDQATLLDSPKVNVAQAESQVRALVEKLTPEQWKTVEVVARDAKAQANDRIFAAYLLVQGEAKTLQSLKDLVVSAIPNEAAGFDVHSEEEHQTVRERALRVMAIDGLATQAEADINKGLKPSQSSAWVSLQTAATESKSEFVKSQANARLQSLKDAFGRSL